MEQHQPFCFSNLAEPFRKLQLKEYSTLGHLALMDIVE
jgi:hypothetical protein